jgi:hypothetical protein
LESLAVRVNNSLRESESRRMLDDLSRTIAGLRTLDEKGRTLLRGGEVSLVSRKRRYHMLLFNDLLVFANAVEHLSADRKRVVSIADQSMIVDLQFDLHSVWLEDLFDRDPQSSQGDAIEIYTPERPYTVYFGSEKDKHLWMAALDETIGKLFNLPSSKTLRDRNLRFVHPDGSIYTGDYSDSLRHGDGLMKWSSGAEFNGKWESDLCHGSGHMLFSFGGWMRGTWVEGRAEGEAQLQTPKGDTFSGVYSKGLACGPGTLAFANQDKITGEWVSGDLEGTGELVCASGASYRGEWKLSKV